VKLVTIPAQPCDGAVFLDFSGKKGFDRQSFIGYTRIDFAQKFTTIERKA
jgi:hypothetical protein